MAKERKLDLFNKVIPAIDKKRYDLYDNLTEEELKEFQTLVIMMWAANIQENDPVLQHYYTASINHHANKNFFSLHKHPKLQWLTIVAGSPELGNYRRKWIGTKKVKDPNADIKKQLAKIYPTYKEQDIEVLSNFVTKKDLKQYDQDCGN